MPQHTPAQVVAVVTGEMVISATKPLIFKRFVKVGDRLVHYRVTGEGPAVVMLHDSPRSSRLHVDTMQALAGRFRVYALDTPGYGNSSPLGLEKPGIDDFSHALAEALAALGLKNAPLYATHTSAKIALLYAAHHICAGDGPPLLLLDGLSISNNAPDERFIETYMRPFKIDATGGYLAAEWTRLRDMLRWFPWFDARPESRMPIAAPSDEWTQAYTLDLLSAGPHYADAYAAAMRYDPRPALRQVGCPTIIAAREDDVLYPCLDMLPQDKSASITVERLAADRERWLDWLTERLAGAKGPVVSQTHARPATEDGRAYVDLPHGQMLVHRAGRDGIKPPLLVLEAPTTLHARLWQEEMTETRPTLVPELPGYGESDPIPSADIADYADALAAMLDVLGVAKVDLLAIGFAAPLGASLANRHAALINRVVFDGIEQADDTLAERLCPVFVQDHSGSHLHKIWHMIRDGEVQWPWFDGTVRAQKTLSPCLSADVLHRTMLDVLKQPDRYGDVALAGLDADPALPLQQPVILFERADEPGYGGVAAMAKVIGNVRRIVRPSSIAEAAALLDDTMR